MGKKKAVKRTPRKGDGIFEKIKPLLLGGGPYFVISILIFAGIYFAGKHIFLDSGLFAIKRIVINKDKDYSLKNGEEKLKKLYLGRNIFSVDLQQVRMMIKKEFPYLRDVEVRRGMPESLEIDILSRTPVAVIDGAGGMLIDAEGVVLALRQNDAELPRIKGLSFFLNVPSRGEKISSEFLDRAIEVLGMFKEKIPSFYNEIIYIDVANRKNLLIGVKGVEIRMGSDGFAEKIEKLGEIFYDPKVDLSYIRYIDLRFDSPVIAPK